MTRHSVGSGPHSVATAGPSCSKARRVDVLANGDALVRENVSSLSLTHTYNDLLPPMIRYLPGDAS